MSIFGVAQERKNDVMKWVKSKKGVNGINELLNMFLDEMAGRLWSTWMFIEY